MGMHFGRYETMFISLVLRGSLVFSKLSLLLGLGLLRILLVLLFFSLVPILGSGHICASSSDLRYCRSCSSAWVILIVFCLVLCGKLVVYGLSLTQGFMFPLTVCKRFDDFFFVTCQVALNAVRHMVFLELTYVPVGLYEVIHSDDAEIVSPEQRLNWLLLIILLFDFNCNKWVLIVL